MITLPSRPFSLRTIIFLRFPINSIFVKAKYSQINTPFLNISYHYPSIFKIHCIFYKEVKFIVAPSISHFCEAMWPKSHLSKKYWKFQISPLIFSGWVDNKCTHNSFSQKTTTTCHRVVVSILRRLNYNWPPYFYAFVLSFCN